jgi:hypothetical protein
MVLAVGSADTSGVLKKMEVERRAPEAHDVDIEIHYCGIVSLLQIRCSIKRGDVGDFFFLFSLLLSNPPLSSLWTRKPCFFEVTWNSAPCLISIPRILPGLSAEMRWRGKFPVFDSVSLSLSLSLSLFLSLQLAAPCSATRTSTRSVQSGLAPLSSPWFPATRLSASFAPSDPPSPSGRCGNPPPPPPPPHHHHHPPPPPPISFQFSIIPSPQ